ncbi:hypothetical protein [Vibrio owensii]|uniref:hypothetical protein n=1 Tax=Vibrio owensii TaxID=696485 RepID=UPI003CC64EAA
MNNNTGYIGSIKEILSNFGKYDQEGNGLLTLAGHVMQAFYCQHSRRRIDDMLANEHGALTPLKQRLLQVAAEASIVQQPIKLNEQDPAATSYQVALPVVFVTEKRPFAPIESIELTSTTVEAISTILCEYTGLPSKHVKVNATLLDEKDFNEGYSKTFMLPAKHAVSGEIYTDSEHLFFDEISLDHDHRASKKFIWINVVDESMDFDKFDFGKSLKSTILSKTHSVNCREQIENALLEQFQPNLPDLAVTAGVILPLFESLSMSESVVREANLLHYIEQIDLKQNAKAISTVMTLDPDTKRVLVRFFEKNELCLAFDYGYECLDGSNSPDCECKSADLSALKTRLMHLGFEKFIDVDEKVSSNLSLYEEDQLMAVI